MNRVYDLVTSSLNFDPRWRVLTTTGPEYQVQRQEFQDLLGSPAKNGSRRQSVAISDEVTGNLEAIKWNIDRVHWISSNATKGLVYFTALNVLCYHFTGWISGIALMYAITIVIFGWISHDFSNLENASLRLKSYLVYIVGPKDRTFSGTQIPAVQIHNDRERLSSTLIYVHLAIDEIERLKTSLPILAYYSYPLRIPLENVSTNLQRIEKHIEKVSKKIKKVLKETV